ncbi:hypothetical protein PENTCL1PPCAC_29146, partial [Pristionchus entomophagus]
MAHVHKCQNIVVSTKNIEGSKMRKFFLKTTDIAVEVLIYKWYAATDDIFGKKSDHWEKMEEKMSNESFSVQLGKGEPLRIIPG